MAPSWWTPSSTLGFARGHVTDPDRAAAFRDRYPDRFRLYATVDTPATDAAIAQLERQVRDLGVDGLKLYLAFFYDNTGEGWRMDGADFATPLLEAARDLGIRNVAVHKALWPVNVSGGLMSRGTRSAPPGAPRSSRCVSTCSGGPAPAKSRAPASAWPSMPAAG